jgi:TonB family protein
MSRFRFAWAVTLAAGFSVTSASAQPVEAPPVQSDAPVPPELSQFVEAEYPAEARDQGLTAAVDLRLTIDAEGNVTDVAVVQAAGHGFDEAATEAAKQFKFKPATRAGRPIASRITYRYQFELGTQTPDSPAPEPASVGSSIAGTVRIREGEGLPIANATVRLRDPSGAVRSARTDAAGRFQFDDLPPGKYAVAFEAQGFEPIEVEEVFDEAERREVTYRLPVKKALDEVLVLGEREDEPPAREVTRRTITAAELAKVPGAGGDALKALVSLPGFARAPAIAGLLIVRGSAPEETGVFLDGTTIPLLYHFGGLSSVIPTELLEKIDFYPSNFSARFGRYTGGVIDVGMRSPDTACRKNGEPTGADDCFHGLAQIDLIDFRLLFSGPLADDWSFTVGARRSWVDLWLGAVLEGTGTTSVTAAPVYYDYQAIVEHRPSPRERLSFRVFGSDDQTRLIFAEPPQPGIGGELGLTTRFVRGQVLYEGQPSDNVTFRAMVSGGYTGTAFSAGNNLDFDFDFFPVEWRTDTAITATEWLTIRAGLDWSVVPTRIDVRAPEPLRPGEQDPGTLVNAQTLTRRTSTTQHSPAAFTEVELRPHPRVLIAPGVRFDYTRQTDEITLDPRLHGRFAVAGPELGSRDRSAQTVLKAGVGLFTQAPALQETDEVFGSPSVDSERSLHSTLGIDQRILPNLTLGVDGYYKHMFSLVSRSADDRGGFRYDNEGSGRVYGGEVLLRYEPDDFFFGWLAYSLSRSERNDGPETPTRLFEYDQTHNLTAVASFKLGSGWQLGGRFRLISGSPYTPVGTRVPSIYAADGTEFIPLNGEPYSERLPLFHQLDLRVDKKWQFEDWALSTYLDIQNVYNFQARESISYSYNFARSSYQLGLPILPSLGLRGEF